MWMKGDDRTLIRVLPGKKFTEIKEISFGYIRRVGWQKS